MRLLRTVSLAATGAIALAAAAPAMAQVVGVAAAVVKEVKVSNAAAPKAKQVTLRQRLALADLIQTGKASQLQILLLDRSSFSIGANASLRIDKFVYDPARGRQLGSSVAKGAFRFMSGQQHSQNSATISTPVASIGIRGTMLDGAVGEAAIKIARDENKDAKRAKSDPKTATLVVLRGPGPGTDPRSQAGAASLTAGGKTVELTGPAQAVFVPAAGAVPIGPFPISSAGLARLNDLVAPSTAVPAKPNGLLGGLLTALPIVTGVIGGSGGGTTGGTTGGQTPPPAPQQEQQPRAPGKP